MSSPTTEFAALYADLRAPVLKLCLNLTGNAALAEDAAQEAFLAAFGALGRFRGDAKVSTWIYRIALRTALRAKARSAREETGADLEVGSDQWSVEMESRAEARRLLAALQTLPVEQRTVISLFAIQELRHSEIAEVLGIPEGTVWSRLHAARRRLAEAMR